VVISVSTDRGIGRMGIPNFSLLIPVSLFHRPSTATGQQLALPGTLSPPTLPIQILRGESCRPGPVEGPPRSKAGAARPTTSTNHRWFEPRVGNDKVSNGEAGGPSDRAHGHLHAGRSTHINGRRSGDMAAARSHHPQGVARSHQEEEEGPWQQRAVGLHVSYVAPTGPRPLTSSRKEGGGAEACH
jgi:hypothetical protein